MDTKKLAKIIKVIVEHELKKQLPTLIEEGVVAELKRRNVEEVKSKPQVTEEVDPFSLATAMLEEDRQTQGETQSEQIVGEMKQYTKNPVLNDILNKTKPFSATGTPSILDENVNNMDKTVNMTTNMAQGGIEAMRASMKQKMGYGGVTATAPQAATGNAALDKALTRDYSELVKRFPTRK